MTCHSLFMRTEKIIGYPFIDQIIQVKLDLLIDNPEILIKPILQPQGT